MSGPNQALHLTGAAFLVSRDPMLLQRPRQVSRSFGFARKSRSRVAKSNRKKKWQSLRHLRYPNDSKE